MNRVRSTPVMHVGRRVRARDYLEVVADPAATEPLVRIGDDVRLGRFFIVWSTVGVEIGNRVQAGDSVTVMDCWVKPGWPTNGPAGARVTIGDDVTLGPNCVIGPGVTVGAGADIAPCATVWDDVPPGAVVVGSPGQVIK
jgi:acetyltransferase-like isoleucine patch superfamily enzyme